MRTAFVRGGKHWCPDCRIANGDGLVSLTYITTTSGERAEYYSCPICRTDFTCDHIDDQVS